MNIHVHRREVGPGEMVCMLDAAEVGRCWLGYKEMSEFVTINAAPGFDQELTEQIDDMWPGTGKITADGFARYLALAYDFPRGGFEVVFNGDDVHVTPPVVRAPVNIGVSIRKIAE